MSHSITALAEWFASHGWPFALPLALLVVCVLPLAMVVFPIAGLGQIIERKVAAAIQRRHGPNSVGLDGVVRFTLALLMPWHTPQRREILVDRVMRAPGLAAVFRFARRTGLGQLVADGVKMLGKEDFVPGGADRPVFLAAPYLAILGGFLAFVVVPFSHHLVMAELSIGLVYVVAVSGLVVVALLMAGWGSNNKWSLLGGMRAVSQVVSYEIPLGLCLATVALWAGTLDLHAIVAAQYHPGALSFLGWNLLAHPFMVLVAGVFFLAGVAECQRAPFDMAEAESELVSGFNTEYSGLRWGMFAMAEYTDMILIGALFAVCFLGGYQSPLYESWIVAQHPVIETLLHLAIFVAKFSLAVVVMVWMRWTLPRFRVDQVMRLCWLTLVPLALLGLVGTAVVMLLAGDAVLPGLAYGRLTAPDRIAYSGLDQVAAWLVAGGLIAGLVWLARRRKRALAPVHPRLAALMGEGP